MPQVFPVLELLLLPPVCSAGTPVEVCVVPSGLVMT